MRTRYEAIIHRYLDIKKGAFVCLTMIRSKVDWKRFGGLIQSPYQKGEWWVLLGWLLLEKLMRNNSHVFSCSSAAAMLVMKMMAELLMSSSNSLSICFSIYFDFIQKAKIIFLSWQLPRYVHCTYWLFSGVFFDVILMANVKSWLTVINTYCKIDTKYVTLNLMLLEISQHNMSWLIGAAAVN